MSDSVKVSSGTVTQGKVVAISGDGTNVEIRWAYTVVKLADNSAHAVSVGLQPYSVNSYLWEETATGVIFNGPLSENTSYSAAWIRGQERRNESASDNFKSVDGFSFKLTDNSFDDTQLGAFLLYQVSDADPATKGQVSSSKYGIKQFENATFDIVSVGLGGSYNRVLNAGNAFVKWDLIYQNGSIDNIDFTTNNAGMNRADVLSATDVDRGESIIFFEGGYSDDQIYSERPYIMDKGIIMNRLGVDHQANSKLTVGGALIHLLSAEDIEYVDNGGVSRSSSSLGLEFDVYAKYQMYKNVEASINFGYLVSGDAMDFYDIKRDGNADNDIIRTTARLRYKF